MKKELVILLEKSYQAPTEIIEKFKQLLEDQPNDYFGKKSNVAHITGSVLVVNEDSSEVLLTNHKKLKKWLQLGGHWCDFDEEPTESITQAAIRELKEEGYGNKDIEYELLNKGDVLDLDIHDVGGHLHYDICFLAKVDKSIPVYVSPESEDVSWLKVANILENKSDFDPRLIRMIEKSQELKVIKTVKAKF